MKGSDYLWITSNGYDFLEKYLISLYGERGSFETNLKLYFSDPIHQCRTYTASSVADVCEISEDDIKSSIVRFDWINKRVNSMVAKYDSYKGNVPDAVSLELAQNMGLCPGNISVVDTLFPFIMNFQRETEDKLNDMLNMALKKPNIISVMVSVMMDGLRYGQIIEHKGHKVWSQGYVRNYYRGENAYYRSSKPSCFRNLGVGDTAVVNQYVRTLQMTEFSIWLNSLSFINKWPYGDVFHGAIAQHYGIPTNGMDVTSDLRTALFFACCKYENGTWRPLKDSEFESPDSRAEVKSMGGDSRYGLLFNLSADISSISSFVSNDDLHITSVTPIGIQPFVRCAAQSGFIIEAGPSYDMYKDYGFNMCKFRLSRHICDWIFQEMDSGQKIYAPELCNSIDDIVMNIKNLKCFSKAAFDIFKEYYHKDEDRDVILNLLHEHGYEIIDDEIKICSEERKQELENTWFRNYNFSELRETPSTYRIGFSI